MAIKVYPNGDNDERKGNVAVFLMNFSNADLSVKCQLITEVVSWGIEYTETVRAGSGWG